MKTKIATAWYTIQTSYWLVPTIMIIIAVTLSQVLLMADKTILEFWRIRHLAYGGTPEGARTVLSTLAGSMITVAGLTFSVTMVAFTLAGSQFGHRMLRKFTTDRGNQFVLGVFLATFIYCLLILRVIVGDGADASVYVPRAAVSFGFLLALVAFGTLIYFFHHVARMVQAGQVIQSVSIDLRRAISKSYPEFTNTESPAELQELSWSDQTDGRATIIAAPADGYVRAVDTEALLRIAIEHDVQVRCCYRAGEFAFCGTPLAAVAPPIKPDKKLREAIQDSFIVGALRSPEQDVKYLIDQLVEVALRALSPAIADPYTAILCLDHLGAAISELHRRAPLPHCQFDRAGYPRLYLRPQTYSELVDAALGPIRLHAGGEIDVARHILVVCERLALTVRNAEHRVVIERHVRLVYKDFRDHQDDRVGHESIEHSFRLVMAALDGCATGK